MVRYIIIMDIRSIIQSTANQIDQQEERMVPSKASKLKDLRILDVHSLVLLNYPIDPTRFESLKEYPYFGQFQNLSSI